MEMKVIWKLFKRKKSGIPYLAKDKKMLKLNTESVGNIQRAFLDKI